MATEFDRKYWEERLPIEALEALAEKTGVSGRVLAINEKVNSRYEADALIEFETGTGPYQYIVECKSNVDRKSLIAQVKSQLEKLSQPGLLIAPYISRDIAEYCRETNLQFIDTHGNAYLNAPGMYVYVKGEKNLNRRTTSGLGRGTNNPTALRIIFTLLCQPNMVQATYREIVESAGVSLGAIGRIFDDLKRRGLLTGAEKTHDRKLLEPKRLLDEWVTNYPIVLRPKLHPRRFSAPDPNWWKGLQLDNLEAVWGGEVAAERLTNHLKPAAQTLYVEPKTMSSCLKYLVTTHRLRPDPYGSIEILEKFWNFPTDPKHPKTAPPILVYADLMATLEPRNTEVAKMIRENAIENTFHQS
jgi:hypothetical protein